MVSCVFQRGYLSVCVCVFASSDVEVAQEAALVIGGADPQLEAAVVVVLEELEKNPPPPSNAPQPPEPVRSKL